jgi:hypothetical protein
VAFDRTGGDEEHLRDLSVGEILACELELVVRKAADVVPISECELGGRSRIATGGSSG